MRTSSRTLGWARRKPASKPGQMLRHQILRHAQPQAALQRRCGQPPDRLLVHRQQAAGEALQQLALLGQRQRPAGTREQAPVELLLKPLDLEADRRLREPDPLAGRGEAAAVGDREEAAQKIGIEVGAHERTSMISHRWHCNNQFPSLIALG